STGDRASWPLGLLLNKKAGPTHETRPSTTHSLLRLFLLSVDLEIDSRSHLLQLLEPLLSLSSICAIGIQLDGLLVSFNGSRSKLGHLLIAHFFYHHLINQGGAQQIPRLWILGIKFRRLLQRLYSIAQPVRVVQADAEVSPRSRCVRRIEFRALGISSFRIVDLPRACQHVPEVVVVARH